MASSLSVLVHKRYGFLAFFLLVSFVLNIWFITLRLNQWFLPWIFTSIVTGITAFFALCVGMGWNFPQRISFKLRVGVIIKIVFWLAGLLTIFSGIMTYILFIEQKNFFWPLPGLFIANLLSLIIGMTVRYAIEEDVKTRKVCEFC